MPGIDGEFGLEVGDRFRNSRFVEVQFPQEEMRERQLRIERDGFLRVLFGDGIELLPQQDARGKKVGCG